MTNKGFTLIEVIVVMIIVGVLAAIALPNMFSWVERSRSSEIAPVLGNIANQIDACASKGVVTTVALQTCIDNLNLASYNTAHFTVVGTGEIFFDQYRIEFKRNALGSPPVQNIEGSPCSWGVVGPPPPAEFDWYGSSDTYGTVILCGYPPGTTNLRTGTHYVFGDGGYKGMY